MLQNLSQRRVPLWIWYRKEASLSLWLWMEALFWSPTHMTNQCNLVCFDSSSALGNYTFIESCPDCFLFCSLFLNFSWKCRYAEIFGYCVCQPPSQNAFGWHWMSKQPEYADFCHSYFKFLKLQFIFSVTRKCYIYL